MAAFFATALPWDQTREGKNSVATSIERKKINRGNFSSKMKKVTIGGDDDDDDKKKFLPVRDGVSQYTEDYFSLPGSSCGEIRQMFYRGFDLNTLHIQKGRL